MEEHLGVWSWRQAERMMLVTSDVSGRTFECSRDSERVPKLQDFLVMSAKMGISLIEMGLASKTSETSESCWFLGRLCWSRVGCCYQNWQFFSWLGTSSDQATHGSLERGTHQLYCGKIRFGIVDHPDHCRLGGFERDLQSEKNPTCYDWSIWTS